jgi:hypothetical protein
MQAIRQSSRATLLALLLVALVSSFVFLMPKSAAASCGPGSYMGVTIIYYTDATFKKISCVETCGDTSCDPTPYRRVHGTCCPL